MKYNVTEIAFYAATGFYSDNEEAHIGNDVQMLCLQSNINDAAADLIEKCAQTLLVLWQCNLITPRVSFHQIRNPDKNKDSLMDRAFLGALNDFKTNIRQPDEAEEKENPEQKAERIQDENEICRLADRLMEDSTPCEDPDDIMILFERLQATEEFLRGMRSIFDDPEPTEPTQPAQPSPRVE